MKSDCGEHQKKLAAYALGDLSKEERLDIEGHLSTCPLCRSERESYARTIGQIACAGEEEIPHHFFIYQETQFSRPWQLFCRMQRRWQAVFAGAAAMILLLCIAAVSRLQIQSHSHGWSISLGRSHADPATLKKEILEAVEKKNQESRAAWAHEAHIEIARLQDTLTQQQKIQLAAAVAGMNSRITERIADSEGSVRNDTQKLISDIYRITAQQRVRDLEAINLRFDSADVNHAIESRQTSEILDTLLQVADMELR
jgi:hypothetical protein